MASTRQDASNGTTISPLRVYSRRPRNSNEISVNGDKDLFRNLPDEMLITILSFLDTKTAISTCILSKRWRNLFLSLTHFDLTLHNPNFAQNPNYAHDKKISPFILNWEERSLVKGEKIIQFIKIIQALLNPKIKSLFIEFRYFNQTYSPLLDECVLNALNYNLNHFQLRVKASNYEEIYTFPLDSLDEIKDSLKILHLSDCALIPDTGFLAFKSLKKLTLTNVIFFEPDIVIEDLEEFLEQVQERFSFLINGCLNLEILSLNLTKDDIVKINAPFSKIKEIELNGCGQSEIICAPKLENLVIYDSEFAMDLKPIPSLKYLKLGFKDDLSYKLSDISFVAPCLETLVLCFEDQMVWLEPERCFGSLMKLRSLVIEAKMHVICNPFWIGLLLEAATNLEKFEINIKANKFPKSFEEIDQQHKPFNFKHKNLKEFKVVGFKGGLMKKNLIQYIMDSATALEKIIVINNDGKYDEFDATQFSSF